MPRRYLITIDIGTSSTKTTLWSTTGAVVAEAAEAYLLERPHPTWAQIDPELWWQAVCKTIRMVIASSGAAPGEVAGIAVDGVSWTLIPLDSTGHVLHPALIWLDRRAEDEAAWLRSLPEASRLIDLAANPLDAAYITPKLLWFKQTHPSLFDRTDTFLTSSAYIVYRLTGEKYCDITQAYGYHFYDMRHACWDAEAARVSGIPLEKLPGLCAPTEVVGEVHAQAAGDVGLAPGAPVIAGGLDASVGALGAGVASPGKTVDQGGQAGGMLLSVDHVIVEPRLIFGHHVLPGQYLLQSGTVGGASLGWLRDVLECRAGNPFEYLSALAAQAPVGSNGLVFLPYMAGERTPLWNSDARGVFFGLSYKTTRQDLARAIMEGCAYAVYHNLVVAQEHGVTVDEWLGDGGAADSEVWCQIKADVTNRPFVVKTRQDGKQGGHSLGLFAMLAHALALRPDMAETVNELLPNERRYLPDRGRHDIYREMFAMYLRISNVLLPEFGNLAKITNKVTN